MSTDRIVRNTGVSTFVYLVGSAAGLIVIPILLRTLGAEQFGLYVIAQTMVSFSTLAASGLNSGFVRSMVAHTQSEGPLGARPVIATGITLMVGVGVTVLLTMALFYPLLLRVFRVPEALSPDFGWILAGVATGYAILLTATPYKALLVTRGRLDVAKGIEGGGIVVNAAASALVVLAGYGLRGVGGAVVVVAVLLAIITFLAAWVIDSKVTSATPSLDSAVVAELWRFGSRLQLVALAGMVNRSVDRVSLGVLRSPAAVAAYDVGDRGAFSLVYTANTMAEALAPRMAAHFANQDVQAARDTYSEATNVFCITAISMAAFAAVNAWTIIWVWLGAGNETSAAAMAVLAAGYGVGVSLSAALVVATAQAKPTLAMRYSIAGATVNVGLSLLGAWLGGVVGAAIGSALSGVVGALVFAVLVERQLLGTHALVGPRALLRSALVITPIAGATAYSTWLLGTALHANRAGGLILLCAAFASQLALTLLIAQRTGLLPRSALEPLLRRLITRK